MKLAVVGAGTMGRGIAQLAAFRGCEVLLLDASSRQLEKALESVSDGLRRTLEKLEAKDRKERLDQVLGRIRTATDAAEAVEVELVIEAVYEDFEVKKQVLQSLDRVCGREVILASNTSSISITRLAAVTGRPERVVGMHFMNPVPIMKLVEVIRGLKTSDDTFRRIVELSERLEKVPVESADSPGFVSNRILMPMLNEAMFAVQEGVAAPEAVDQVMKLGMRHPMGPLQLADFIGLDVCLDILKVLHEGFGDPKYRPCPLLRRMVEAGYLGVKSGRGFYEYPDR